MMNMHEKICREISILSRLKHPHVIRLYELVDTPSDIFMVMEFVPGGELFDHIVQKLRIPEDEARRFFQEIIAGVEFCHHHAVVHRDLKPENLLLDGEQHIKIADFGLSNIMRNGDYMKTSCGSPNYASPEVVSGKSYVGPEVDVWSCGVVLYALLSGSLPFDDENVPNLFRKIKHGNFTIPGHLSTQAKGLIVKMLVVDPTKRITLAQIRETKWFQHDLKAYLTAPLKTPIAIQEEPLDPVICAELRVCGIKIDMDKPEEIPHDHAVAYNLLLDRKMKEDIGNLAKRLPALNQDHLSIFSGKMLSQVRTIYGLTTAPLHSLHRERRPPRSSYSTGSVSSRADSENTASATSARVRRWRLGCRPGGSRSRRRATRSRS
jgi:5'-AMP-activated protein kinase catalytic alpha subunit